MTDFNVDSILTINNCHKHKMLLKTCLKKLDLESIDKASESWEDIKWIIENKKFKLCPFQYV